MKNLIRFDQAIKKLLRDQANFVITEGFLSVVLNQEIKILEVLEGKPNRKDENDKFNKLELLVSNQSGELLIVIIEVQNKQEYDYLRPMFYGTSKVIAKYSGKHEKYPKPVPRKAVVKKVYAITITYFDLGQGDDYIYCGQTSFTGIHNKDLERSPGYPEYYIIQPGKLDDQKVSGKLDEWVYFLKNGKIPDSFTAPGLKEAREMLAENRMSL